jgi:hypothetical protein
MAAKKWDMVAAVVSHPVRLILKPQAGGSVSPAARRTEVVEKAEAVLLRDKPFIPRVAMMIPFNLACYPSVTRRMEQAKERLRHAIDLDKDHPPPGHT